MRRIITTTAIAIALTASLAPAATASTGTAAPPPDELSSGRNVNTYWTQVDGPPGPDQPFGNVHVGWLDAEETSPGFATAFTYIEDFSCPEGATPHEWSASGTSSCEWIGSRHGVGEDMAFQMDAKHRRARLTGTITMSVGGGHGEDGEVVGRPQADIVWTGTQNRWSSNSRYVEIDGEMKYVSRYKVVGRNATMSGSLGPMGFDPELSGGSMSTWRSTWSQRPR